MVVHIVIVVPVFLAGHIVPHADEKSFVLQMGLVRKLDVEIESVVAIVGLLLSHIMVEFGSNLRGGLPVVKGEASNNVLAERNVRTSDNTNEHFLVGRQENSFHPDSSGIALKAAGREVCKADLPLGHI